MTETVKNPYYTPKPGVPPDVRMAASLMGKLAKNIQKTITKAESKHRADRLAVNRYRGGRKPGATNLANRQNGEKLPERKTPSTISYVHNHA